MLSARSQTFPRPLQLPAEHRRQPTPKKKKQPANRQLVEGGRGDLLQSEGEKSISNELLKQSKSERNNEDVTALCEISADTETSQKKPTQLVILLLRKGDGRQRQTTKQLT